MSQNNYGERNLAIVIPIEIIPEEVGIDRAIRETSYGNRARIKKGISEKFYDDSVFTQMDNDGLPKGRAESIPSEGNNPIQTLRRLTGKSGLIQGVPPTNPSYMKTSLEGTANVPRGGNAPIDKSSFYQGIKKVKSPGAGLHVYGEGEPSALEGMMGRILGGPSGISKAMGMLKNPIAFVKFLGPLAAPVFAGLIAVEVAKKVINELVRKGSVYDRTFRNVIDTRNEALRTREQQQRILVGFGDGAQLITTTSAGTTSPRDSYNTYEQFNHNQKVLEEKFAIRNDSGYD